MSTERWPNKSLQPTPGSVFSSATRFASPGPAWLSFFRLSAALMRFTVKPIILAALMFFVTQARAGHAVLDYQIGFAGLGGYCGLSQCDLTDQYDDGKRHWQTDITFGQVGFSVPMRGSWVLVMICIGLLGLAYAGVVGLHTLRDR